MHRSAAIVAASEHAASGRFAIDDLLKACADPGDEYRGKLRCHPARLKSLLPGLTEPPKN